jgi:hypothetical protein
MRGATPGYDAGDLPCLMQLECITVRDGRVALMPPCLMQLECITVRDGRVALMPPLPRDASELHREGSVLSGGRVPKTASRRRFGIESGHASTTVSL